MVYRQPHRKLETWIIRCNKLCPRRCVTLLPVAHW